MAELWEGLRQRQDVVFGDDNEIAILGCQGASLSLLSPCGQRIFSKRSPFHKPREQHLVARQLHRALLDDEEFAPHFAFPLSCITDGWVNTQRSLH